MGSRYFCLIENELIKQRLFYGRQLQLGNEVVDDYEKLKLYEVDVGLLHTFFWCLETWDYYTTSSAAADDVQRKLGKSFTSIITHLKRIWVLVLVEEDNLLKTWPEEPIQDFHLVSFRLEAKIQQSKPLIQQCCQISMLQQRNSSVSMAMQMQMQCKSSCTKNHDMILHIIDKACRNLNFLENIVPIFKNQMEILKEMLQFMSDSLSRVRRCIDSKELVEYRNFVHAFFNNTTCLVCLYWTQVGANDDIETATEMSIALLDMLHKIKPCAADVTTSYFGILKSNNLLHSDDDYGKTHANFVDFFFEHTILKDHFLIFRQRLILLFTFLTDDPPRENKAKEEEDLIRNQIYVLLREDAYLLLPISEMKQQDFSNNNMLLSDFINRIEILTAKIIRPYCTPSDSWSRLEAEKMNNLYFASLQRELSSIEHRAKWSFMVMAEAQPHLYLTEIRFLRLFLQCFETWDDSDEETRLQLNSIVTSLQIIWGQEYEMGLLSGRLFAIGKQDFTDWKYLLDLELKVKIQMSKQEVDAWLLSLSHCSFHCRPSISNKILKFLDSILYNMSDLVSTGACNDVAFKKQIEILKEKLLFLKDLLTLAKKCTYSKNLEEFIMLAQVFLNNAACLVYVYWAKEADNEIPAETNLMLSKMLQKIKPDTPHVARMYIEALKAICLQPYDALLLEKTATSFVDYFFEDMVFPWKNDFKILRDEVIFHMTFVHHHHIGNAEEIICNQLDVLFTDGVYDLLPFDDVKGDFFEKKVGLSGFMMNVAKENAKIRQLYCKFPDSFQYNFPRIIGQGFIDCLMQKLRNLMERMISDQKYIPFAKYRISTIEEELVYLTPIFNQILELKNLNGAWLEVVNVVYLAEHAVSLCFIFYHLVWHYIPYLSDVADRIKAVRTKLEKIKVCDIARCLSHSADFMSTHLKQDQTSEIHRVFVGFEVDEKIIMDNITRGTKSLDIVSIVGMGGLGKTTLVKKVYDSTLVRSHFNIFAFFCVSQDYNKRRLLLDILKDIVKMDDDTSHMTEDDLAHKLKKCLSRQKYLIVLDDIWNINVWDEVRNSFPDDRNGSRVMFTTRSLEVAKRGQIKCSPHRLRFLTEDESWQLLQKKVFQNDMPPPNITDVAKLIAKKCDGLPLAIVVIAGLLVRTETSLWIEISTRVSSYLFDEGCMNILELSYKHLPEYLKPCILYFGAFPEGSSYRVKLVTLLWIDEGFIKESKTKSLNDVAKEYLYELVDRSLIIVDEMTIGEIRTFRVHDLIHDFCRKKCLEKKFFQLGHGTETSSFSAPLQCNHYRVSMQKLYKPSLTNTRSLLCFTSKFDYYQRLLPLRNFRFVQVLYLKGIQFRKSDFAHMISLIDLRHIKAEVLGDISIPSSISNLWNMQSLILKSNKEIYLPETLWTMKSLRHVKIHQCKFELSEGYELSAYPQLDKVVSFSRPFVSTGKDVEWLLQRLPAVRKLSCIWNYKSLDSIEERVETLDFHRKLESLKLCNLSSQYCPYLINFPSTLIKLTLENFELSSSTAISVIAELQCLRILKLREVSFPGTTWETEDLTFPNLKYFELRRSNLELWNANSDSFPCLEQLLFDVTILEELLPCFGEISSLKKITIWDSLHQKFVRSALRVQDEQTELGNQVKLEIYNGGVLQNAC